MGESTAGRSGLTLSPMTGALRHDLVHHVTAGNFGGRVQKSIEDIFEVDKD